MAPASSLQPPDEIGALARTRTGMTFRSMDFKSVDSDLSLIKVFDFSHLPTSRVCSAVNEPCPATVVVLYLQCFYNVDTWQWSQ
jgi:hypothetical protein